MARADLSSQNPLNEAAQVKPQPTRDDDDSLSAAQKGAFRQQPEIGLYSDGSSETGQIPVSSKQQAPYEKQYSDGSRATGSAPLPDQSPEQQDAARAQQEASFRIPKPTQRLP
jgi:hypothetical protein